MESALKKILLASIVAAVFALGLYWFHYIPDDAYIGFRYAENAARGEGLVFNPGERVEGYTNFLWVIILASVSRLGLPLAGTARFLGLLFSIGTLVVSWRACSTALPVDRHGYSRAAAAIAAPLIVAASAPFATWSFSGTEIPLFTFLLTIGMLSLSIGKGPFTVFTIFALLTLTRPEGAAYYLLAAVLLLVRGEKRRSVATGGALITGLLLLPFLLWKSYYYGGILPNTFYAKTGPTALLLRNGIAYAGRFAAWHIWLPAAAILLLRTERNRGVHFARLTLPISIIALNWLIVILFGGDWMPQFRLLVPSIPAMAVMTAASIPYLNRSPNKTGLNTSPRQSSSLPRSCAALAIVFACVTMAPGSFDYEGFLRERTIVRTFSNLGKRLGKILPVGTSLGCGSTGAIGYFSGLPIVDILGLTEPEIARRGKIVSRQPGHMKTLGSHILDRRPDLLLLGNIQLHRGRRPEDLKKIKVQEMDIILDPRFTLEYEFINLPLVNNFYLSCYRRTGSSAVSE